MNIETERKMSEVSNQPEVMKEMIHFFSMSEVNSFVPSQHMAFYYTLCNNIYDREL